MFSSVFWANKMPYYCTVPRCTSMAGKAKNVSFHQFPRDEELAKLWNKILKRGKPYTKYSKVCSLHFKPEDYTITSVGKNRGMCLFCYQTFFVIWDKCNYLLLLLVSIYLGYVISCPNVQQQVKVWKATKVIEK